ncbi:MlaD family protein [Candidatus Hydrogenedentota bacterium]
MANRKSSGKDTIVGAFVLGAVVLMVIALLIMGREEQVFEDRFEIRAIFPDAAGLREGARVQLAGIDIGMVDDVAFNKKTEAVITMTVLSEIEHRIGPDSTAEITSKGLLGDKIVSLTTSMARFPEGMNRVKAVPFFNVMSELRKAVGDMEPSMEDMRETMGNLNKLTAELSENSANISTILEGTAEITGSIRNGEGLLGELIKNDTAADEIFAAVSDARETAKSVRMAAENLDKTLDKLPGLTKTGENTLSAIAETSKEIRTLIVQLQKTMENIEEASRSFPEIATDIAETSRQIPDLVESAQMTVDDTREAVNALKKVWPIRDKIEDNSEAGVVGLD